jgi:PPOX class probable F420-dependent enzyme
MLDWQRDLLLAEPVGHLATVDEAGQPHVVPVVFAFDGRQLFTPLDGKPKRVAADKLQRVRNIQAHNRVALVVDRYDADWRKLAWVQVRGAATVLADGAAYDLGIGLLRQKYPQYATTPLAGRPLISISPERIRGWRADADESERDL